jgi:hypothetical protein
MCGVWMYLNNTYIKQKEIAENFHFIAFLKLDTLFHKLLEQWIVRCRRKLRLQQSKFMMM